MSGELVFGIEPLQSLRQFASLCWFPKSAPLTQLWGDKMIEGDASWVERNLQQVETVAYQKWTFDDASRLYVHPGPYIFRVTCGGLLRFPELLDDLSSVVYEVCAVGSILDWKDVLRRTGWPRCPSLGGNHPPGGVAVAFKGEAGHSRLVSRRWLDHGPWALLRREDVDLSVVLFHDPDLTDPVAALDQSYPGHQRMGISPTGGYMHVAHKASTALSGTWLEAERRLVIVVHGREVSQAEMLDACALRRDAGGTERPVETVTYLFAEESAARAHLHELWLRGLEVRCIRAGREVRLDADYRPAPEVPSWVPGVRARWQALLDGM